MKSPFILYELGNIEIFDSLNTLCLDVEAIDVKNDEYLFFDSTGMVLLPSIHEESEKVELQESDNKSKIVLRYLLIQFLQQFDYSLKTLRSMDLDMLIQECKHPKMKKKEKRTWWKVFS